MDIRDKKNYLTDKLWRSKDVLELISCLDLMSNAKIYQLDPGVGDVLIQQHYVLWLKDKTMQQYIIRTGITGFELREIFTEVCDERKCYWDSHHNNNFLDYSKSPQIYELRFI